MQPVSGDKKRSLVTADRQSVVAPIRPRPATPSKIANDAKPVARGPHAERTAMMRQRLIEAAIACLNKVGYAATTTQLVVETAGVSRGAILHHFPAKVDLMLAVAEYAAGKQNRYVRRRLADVPEGMDRFLAMTTATWEVMILPPAQALLEIMIASRSDPILAARLPPAIKALEDQQRDDVWSMAQDLGITDEAAIQDMIRLHRAAMRGLAIELVWSGDSEAAERSMRLLNYYKNKLTGELIIDGRSPLPRRN